MSEFGVQGFGVQSFENVIYSRCSCPKQCQMGSQKRRLLSAFGPKHAQFWTPETPPSFGVRTRKIAEADTQIGVFRGDSCQNVDGAWVRLEIPGKFWRSGSSLKNVPSETISGLFWPKLDGTPFGGFRKCQNRREKRRFPMALSSNRWPKWGCIC